MLYLLLWILYELNIGSVDHGGHPQVHGPAFLAHARQRVSNIVGLTALRLAFFMGYGPNKVVQWFLYSI